MGSGRWDDDKWAGYTTSRLYSTKSTAEIYSSRSMDKALDPKGVKIRESRDSTDNPNSNAIIVGLDVTGSMHRVLDVMARQGLKTLVSEIYNRKPVTDPHIMCMGVGDAEHDRAPLQVTQFEADIKIAEQLEKVWLEGGGGGNNYESYALPWFFAARHTAIDCFEKRGRKGYLFTVGDEEPTPRLTAEALQVFLGDKVPDDLSMKDLLTEVSRQWEVFHLIVEEGDYAARNKDRLFQKWSDVLGQRALRLADHTKMAEVIVSTIQINEGTDSSRVVGSWDKSTALVVGKAISSLTKGAKSGGGIATL